MTLKSKLIQVYLAKGECDFIRNRKVTRPFIQVLIKELPEDSLATLESTLRIEMNKDSGKFERIIKPNCVIRSDYYVDKYYRDLKLGKGLLIKNMFYFQKKHKKKNKLYAFKLY